MPAIILQEGSHQSIRKQEENFSYVILHPVLKSIVQVWIQIFICRLLLRKMGVLILILLLKSTSIIILEKYDKEVAVNKQNQLCTFFYYAGRRYVDQG